MTVTAHRVPTLGGVVAAYWTPVEDVLLLAEDALDRVERHRDDHGEFVVSSCPCGWRGSEIGAYDDRDRDEAALEFLAHVDTDHRAAPAPSGVAGSPGRDRRGGAPVTPTPGAPPQGNHATPADYGAAGSGNDTTTGDQA